MSVKEMVEKGKRVRFTRFHAGELWYVTESGFQFPVPLSDTGDGSFLSEDKAMLYMRWIRKQWEAVASETVRFARYSKGELWFVTDAGFEFPVPVAETAGKEWRDVDRAEAFLPWIHQHAQMLEQERSAAQGALA